MSCLNRVGPNALLYMITICGFFHFLFCLAERINCQRWTVKRRYPLTLALRWSRSPPRFAWYYGIPEAPRASGKKIMLTKFLPLDHSWNVGLMYRRIIYLEDVELKVKDIVPESTLPKQYVSFVKFTILLCFSFLIVIGWWMATVIRHTTIYKVELNPVNCFCLLLPFQPSKLCGNIE